MTVPRRRSAHPACISSAVAVGSTTKGDVVSSFSNIGDTSSRCSRRADLDGRFLRANNIILSSVAAITDILSSSASKPQRQTPISCAAGTSMATPHVAGAIAAVQYRLSLRDGERNSERFPEQRPMRSPIRARARPAPSPSRASGSMPRSRRSIVALVPAHWSYRRPPASVQAANKAGRSRPRHSTTRSRPQAGPGAIRFPAFQAG